MDYFRAVLLSNEISQRAFDLTTQVIKVSPSFYSAWHYRKFLFLELKKDLQEELDFLSKKSKKNPKNYQVWYYRKFLVDRCQNADSEFLFIDEILKADERNVHAWGHRQLLTSKFQLWKSELINNAQFLELNPRNHSAWTYRFFLLEKSNSLTGNVRCSEFEFVKIFMENPLNESCYKFVEWIFSEELSGLIKNKVAEVIREVGVTPALLQLLLFIYKREAKIEICKVLGKKLEDIDSIHEEYWKSVIAELKGKNIERTIEDRKLHVELVLECGTPSVMWLYYSNLT